MKKHLQLLKMPTALFTGMICLMMLGITGVGKAQTPPSLNCTEDITEPAEPGKCSAVITYTAPSAPAAIPQTTETFNYTGSIVNWSVPEGVTSITIEARGAQGAATNNNGGTGAIITGTVSVIPGQQLKILVGGMGVVNSNGAGGGGGSFITTSTNIPLVIAGGGGGIIGSPSNTPGVHANITNDGNDGYSVEGNCASCKGIGGINGNGATNALNPPAAGNGGGLLTDGSPSAFSGAGIGYNLSGFGYVNGGSGGIGHPGIFPLSNGGFGGAGGGDNWGAGGGGGYSGGGGSWHIPTNGGGGGSYNSGINQNNSIGNIGNGLVTITYGSASYTVTQIAGLPSGSAFPVGTTTNTFEINDGNGNTSTCSFNVTVTDDTDPTITAPEAITVSTNDGCKATNVNLGIPVTDDNCSDVTVTNNAPEAFPLGNTTVTWTVTDGNGRTATATQLVKVTDDTDPTITAPEPITASTNEGCTSTNVDLGTPETDDNCSVMSVTNNAPAAFPLGNTTVTWTVTDGSGRTATATQLVTVTDGTDPTITAPEPITASTNEGCTSTNVDLGTPETEDNCSDVTVTNNAPEAFPLGETIVVWTATDESGNKSTANQVITVTDNINPTITTLPNKTANTDAGLCTKTFTLAQIGTPTANDNCSATISWTRSDGASTLDSPFPFGSTTITWKATDGAGNSATAEQTITIENVTTAVTVSVSPTSQQYSDEVTFTANVTVCEEAGNIGGTVEFKVGSQVMGTANVGPYGTATLEDVALLEPTSTGVMAPGGKTVTASYSGSGDYLSSSNETNLTITKEDAEVTYNGGSFFSANPSTYQGTIVPSAFVVDNDDDSRGDIQNATVTFREGSAAGSALGSSNIPVGLVSSSVTTEGVASTSFNYTLSNSDLSAGGKIWDVWTTVDNYYDGQSAEYVPVTLGLPGPDYVTGGGHIVMSNSSGIYAGDAGRKMNFGLVMKWNKSGKSLQGNINIVYRRSDGNYQIKSNAINSLVVENVNDMGKVVTGSAVTYRRATITTKANLKKLNPDGTSQDLGGNLTLTVTAWESTTVKTGASDRISVQLAGSNGSGINFSSSWSGGNTIAQQLGGGKIQVFTPTTKSAQIPVELAEAPLEPSMKAYPNPFTEKLFIEFSHDKDAHARLDIYSITGARLETLFDQSITGGEVNKVEYLPKLRSSQMVLYHLIIDGKTYVGKVTYNERR